MLIKRCKNLPPAAPASTSRCANVCIVVVKVVKRMHNVQLTDMLFSSRGASATGRALRPSVALPVVRTVTRLSHMQGGAFSRMAKLLAWQQSHVLGRNLSAQQEGKTVSKHHDYSQRSLQKPQGLYTSMLH